MKQVIEYYIKHPDGRYKIEPRPANEAEAVRVFNSDYTARTMKATRDAHQGKDVTGYVTYNSKNPKRALIREIKEIILTDEV